MKKAAFGIILLFLLSGCANARQDIDRAMELRSGLLAGAGCDFRASITADYGDTIQSFTMDCRADELGNLSFTVTEPDSIAGITGKLSKDGGALTFDGTALSVPMLADGQLAPVSAPWVFLNTLRSGYLTSAGREEDLLRVSIDDSYEENALQLDIWLNGENLPVRGEILYDGRRILSLVVENFRIR